MSYNNASSNFHDLQFYDEDDEANVPTGYPTTQKTQLDTALNVYREEKSARPKNDLGSSGSDSVNAYNICSQIWQELTGTVRDLLLLVMSI